MQANPHTRKTLHVLDRIFDADVQDNPEADEHVKGFLIVSEDDVERLIVLVRDEEGRTRVWKLTLEETRAYDPPRRLLDEFEDLGDK